MRGKAAAVLAIAVALLFIGQAVSYYLPTSGFSIDTETDGSDIRYTIHSGFDSQYSEIHLDNAYDIPSRYYLLVDDSYQWCSDPSGIEPTYYFLQKEFDKCPSLSLEPKTVEEIGAMMADSVASGTFGIGVIVNTGSLPDVLYDGTASSLILQWMSSGGTLYWTGGCFGKYISAHNGITEVPDYSESVCLALFGSAHLFNESGMTSYGNTRLNEPLTSLSGAYYAETTCGVDMDRISSPHIFLGYTDGTYASITIMKYGSGQLTTFGNYATFQNSEYLAHVIAMRLTYSSEIVSSSTGSIDHKTYSSSFATTPGITHVIVVHNLKWSAAWVYDPAQQRFV